MKEILLKYVIFVIYFYLSSPITADVLGRSGRVSFGPSSVALVVDLSSFFGKIDLVFLFFFFCWFGVEVFSPSSLDASLSENFLKTFALRNYVH